MRRSFNSQTLRAAQGLGTTVHTQAVNAFTDAMATGLGVVAVIVLIAAAVVARGLGGRHRRAEL